MGIYYSYNGLLACRVISGWFWFGFLLCVGFRLVFFTNVRLWNRWSGVVRSFLALFRGSSGRWVVARGGTLYEEFLVQGAVTPSRFVQKNFTIIV